MNMVILDNIEDVREWRKNQRNYKIAFVPTMGALHEGHLSLVKEANNRADKVIVSIYVNPLQFNNPEDLNYYPRNIHSDLELLKQYKVDAVFLPDDEIMYQDNNPKIQFKISEDLINKLCGKSRPGHFEGVCQIVAKLFNIVAPDSAFFGLKDYQQCKIIEELVNSLNYPLKLFFCPIIRDKNGLALSSRNLLIGPDDKNKALGLYKALKLGYDLIDAGEKSVEKVKNQIISKVEEFNLKVEYIELLNANDLGTIKTVKKPILLAGAVYCGKVRLIDNIIYS